MNLTSLPEDCSLEDIHHHLYVLIRIRSCISRSAVMDEHPPPCLSKTGSHKDGHPFEIISDAKGWATSLRWMKTNHERLPEARVSSLCSCLRILAGAQGNYRQMLRPPFGLRRLQVPIVGTLGQSPWPGILRHTHPGRINVPLG